MPPRENFKKNWPEKLPQSARKMIFTAAIAVLMLIIVSLWLLSLKNILARPRPEEKKDKNFETIQKDLEKFLAETRNYLDEAKDRLNSVTSQNGSTELSAAGVEKLKEKLIAKQTGDWQIYFDNNYKFELKYPGDWQAIAAPGGQELIVSFRTKAALTDLVAVKKYASAAEILSLPNVKKHWPISNGQLVIFDYINSTTSDLLIDTFKLLE